MASFAGIIWNDLRGLGRACGWAVALKWLGMIVLKSPQIVKHRNLQPADRAMGPGPFEARLGPARAQLVGRQVISGIRETWVRNVYLGSPGMSIPPDAVVVDLGANMGNVSLLALGHGPGVSVVAVESNPACCEQFRRSLAANGWQGRARLCQAFVGGRTSFQQTQLDNGEAEGTPFLSEQELIEKYGLSHIDFLKCDIEGSEFELFHEGSRLLAITDRLAVEVHDHAGDRRTFVRILEEQGFVVRVHREDPHCCIVHAVRPRLLEGYDRSVEVRESSMAQVAR